MLLATFLAVISWLFVGICLGLIAFVGYSIYTLIKGTIINNFLCDSEGTEKRAYNLKSTSRLYGLCLFLFGLFLVFGVLATALDSHKNNNILKEGIILLDFYNQGNDSNCFTFGGGNKVFVKMENGYFIFTESKLPTVIP